MKRDPKWDAKAVTRQTPYDIRAFITQKCGPVEAGYEGKKVDALAHLMLTQTDARILFYSFPLPFRLMQLSHCGIEAFGQMRALLSGGLMKKMASGESHTL